MSALDLLELQRKFKCQKCGKCCWQGVGVSLLPSEACKLGVPVNYTQYHPCGFLDLATMQCRIHDDKPYACSVAPFMSLYDGLTSFDTLLICPGALKALADFFEVKQEH